MSGLDAAVAKMKLDCLTQWEIERIEAKSQKKKEIEQIDLTITELNQKLKDIREAYNLVNEYDKRIELYMADKARYITCQFVKLMSHDNFYYKLDEIIYKEDEIDVYKVYIPKITSKDQLLEFCWNEYIKYQIKPKFENERKYQYKDIHRAYEIIKDFFTKEQYQNFMENYYNGSVNYDDRYNCEKLLNGCEYFNENIKPTMNEETLKQFYSRFSELLKYGTSQWSKFGDLLYFLNDDKMKIYENIYVKNGMITNEELESEYKVYEEIIKARRTAYCQLCLAYKNDFDCSQSKEIIDKLKKNDFAVKYYGDFIYRHSRMREKYNDLTQAAFKQTSDYINELIQTRKSMNEEYEHCKTVMNHQRVINELNNELAKLNNNDYKYAIDTAKLIIEIDELRKLI